MTWSSPTISWLWAEGQEQLTSLFYRDCVDFFLHTKIILERSTNKQPVKSLASKNH